MQQDDPEKRRKEAAKFNRFLAQQRGRREYQSAPQAAKAVSKIMKPLSAKFGAGRSGLTEHWEDIVGPRFARISHPVRYLGGREGRTLLISAPGPAAALITAAGQGIIDRANGYLGPGYIRHIKVVQSRIKESNLAGSRPNRTIDLTPGQTEKLKSSLEKVRDPDLKKALEKLGRSALRRPE